MTDIGPQPLGLTPGQQQEQSQGQIQYDPTQDAVITGAPQPSAYQDMASLDTKLQYMGSIEQGWGLPQIPDQVKLDLAAIPNTSHEDLGSLLWGLASDLNPLSAQAAGAAEPNQTFALQGLSNDQFNTALQGLGNVANPAFSTPQDPNAGINQIRSLVGGIEGQKAPSVVDPNATTALLKRAIGYGILPASTPVDGSYAPGDSSVFSQVAYADLQSRIAGNEPGAMSIKSIYNTLGDFLDPKHLMNAAWNAAFHSFVPSAHDISGMFHSITDFVKDPLDPSKLLHAFTSQIPVVTPIVTDVLLLTGVGEVIGAGRAALTGADTAVGVADAAEAGETAYKSGSLAERLGGHLGMGEAGLQQGAQDLGQFDGQGLASKLLDKYGGSVGSMVSDGMDAWRTWKPAQVARLAAQSTFRLGTVELAGARLSPASSTLNRSVSHFKLGILDNPIVSQGVNLLSLPLAPPSIFRPGTFNSVIEPTTNLLKQVVMAGRDYDDARTTMEVIKGLSASSPTFAESLKKANNPIDALADHLGGDREAAGSFVAYSALHTAIDNDGLETALRQYPDSAQLYERKKSWLLKRGATTAQLVHLDNDDVQTFLDTMGRKAARQGVGLSTGKLSQLGKDLASGDESVRGSALDFMHQIIDDHNAKRAGVAASLLGALKPGQVEAHVRDFFGNEDNWHNYIAAWDDVRHNALGAGDGVLDADPQMLEDGRLVRSQLRREPAYAPTGQSLKLGDSPFSSLASKILDKSADPELIKNSWTMPATKDLVDAAHRFSIARLGTPTVQDQARLLSQFKVLQRVGGSIDYISKNPDLQQKLGTLFAGTGVAENQRVPQDVLQSALQDILPSAGDKVRRAVSTINNLNADADMPFSALKSEGGAFSDLPSAKAAVQSQVDGLERQVAWRGNYGIDASMPLDQKLKLLRRMMNLTASDVENVPPELAARVKGYGYKLVAGAHFVHPQDLMDLVEPYTSLTKTQVRRLSLGTYFLPHQNDELASVMRSALHTHLTDALVNNGLLDRAAPPEADPFSGDVNDIIQRLYGAVRGQQNQAQFNLDHATGLIKKFRGNVDMSLAPQGLRDLSPGDIKDALSDLDGIGDNNKVLNGVQKAILQSNDVGFRYNGLATIEDKLRQWNLLTDGLLLGKTSAGGMLKHLGVAAGIGAGAGVASQLAQGNTNPEDLLSSAAAGGFKVGEYQAVREAMGVAGRRGLSLLGYDANNWARYAYLPDTLAKVRNAFRFTLSPMFDLRRYTKGALVAQMVADHEGGPALPLVNSIKGLDKTFGSGSMKEARSMWNAASKGEYQNFEDTEREFTQRGILSYSPQDQMAMTNYRLVKGGVDPAKAANMVNKIYGYGSGRSAAEKSLNFAFFPFSFEKKLLANSGKFLNDDFARLMMVHDGLKTYDLLNKNFDLSKELQDHVPLMRDIEKLNPYDHGVDLGEFGGINAPFIRLFTPVILHAEGLDQHKDIQNVATRLLPAFNDIDRMVGDLQSQGHVIFGSSHLTPQAEANAGFDTMNALKLQTLSDLKSAGYKDLAQMNNDQVLAPLKSWYDNQKAEIMAKYPAYQTAIAQAGAKADLNTEAMQVDLRREGPAFDTLRLFNEYQSRLKTNLSDNGYAASAAEDYPTGTFPQVEQAAVWFYRQTADRYGQAAADQFRALYAKYFSRVWGPIERPI